MMTRSMLAKRHWIAVTGLVLAALFTPAIAAEKVFLCQEYGTKGDAQTDDTAALQRAVDAAAGTGGTVQIPSGIYMIDASVGISLRSQMQLQLDSGAILRAIPNYLKASRVLMLKEVTGVAIRGGTIEGERHAHTGQVGEWGMGIEMRQATEITIDHLTIRDCWGDGIYISQRCQGIRIRRLLADKNRRQGLTVTSASDVEIRESVFRNTTGTSPECGVDIEPNKGETVSNCRVIDCLFIGNAGGGIQAGVPVKHRGESFVTGFIAQGNTLMRNGPNRPPAYSILISGCQGAIVQKNQLNGNLGTGIGVLDSAETQIEGNTVRKTQKSTYRADAGLLVKNSTGTTVRDNTIMDNQGYGIYLWGAEVDTTSNQIERNAQGDLYRR